MNRVFNKKDFESPYLMVDFEDEYCEKKIYELQVDRCIRRKLPREAAQLLCIAFNDFSIDDLLKHPSREYIVNLLIFLHDNTNYTIGKTILYDTNQILVKMDDGKILHSYYREE